MGGVRARARARVRAFGKGYNISGLRKITMEMIGWVIVESHEYALQTENREKLLSI